MSQYPWYAINYQRSNLYLEFKVDAMYVEDGVLKKPKTVSSVAVIMPY